MEVSIDADGVGELDGWEGDHVFFDVFGDVGDVAFVSFENLSCQYEMAKCRRGGTYSS